MRRRKRIAVTRVALRLGLGMALLASTSVPVRADDYHDSLERLVGEHKRVAAARADHGGAESAAAKAGSAWFPDLTATASAGHQRVALNNDATPTSMHTRELTFGLRQTLWDFGAINSAIEKAEIGVRLSSVTLSQVSRDLLLEGITAYINLERARRSLGYAENSVANIAKQTGMEESRVELGGGFSSDVLQAKSQLAGAEAKLSRSKGMMANAVNRFRAVFGRHPIDDDPQQKIPVPFDLLPGSLEDAVSLGRKHNTQLEILRLTAESSRAEIDRVRAAELGPNIHAIAQRKFDRNPDGLAADRVQNIIKVELTYQFNTGLGAFHAIDSAQHALVSAEAKYAEVYDIVEEQVRNAWSNLASAQDTARHLENQMRISGEFLRLAREERLQGRRSLIDVLSGETSLINAQSDAASADADVSIAAFTVLRATGLLDLTMVR
ncbi:MAG: TolC family protein [Rhodospirillaceae bacterium]